MREDGSTSSLRPMMRFADIFIVRGWMASGTPQRVTPANQPGSHSYDISPNGKWAFHTVSTFDRPPVTELISLPDHKVMRTLEANEALAQKRKELISSPTEFFQVPVSNGVKLDGWMIKPPDFDPKKKYPVLVYIYGEPAGATVTDAWGGSRRLFHELIARQGYLVVSFDNQGTPAPKGREWRKIVYGDVWRAVLGAAGGSHSRTGQRARLHRFVASGHLGMERRRIEYAEHDVSLSRSVQGGNRGGSRRRPETLRHHLSGTLHGTAAG